MIHPCPLPVDWLDYLSGTGDAHLDAHLAGCESCRELVASLREDLVIPNDWSSAFADRTDATWHEERAATPSPTEFWLSSASYPHDADVAGPDTHHSFSHEDVDRVLLLVIGSTVSDHVGDVWHDVVPVLSDVERATDTDLMFTHDHNTLGTPWRAMFKYQCKVSRAQLDTRVGTLTYIGADLLEAALAGTAAEECWGTPLAGLEDPRAEVDEHLDDAMRRLRTPWLLAIDALEDHTDTEPSAHARAFDELLEFVASEVRSEDRALAAADTSTAGERVWELTTSGLHVIGSLRNDYDGNGDLLFDVRQLNATRTWRVRLVVYIRGDDVPLASEPFDLATGEHVRIGSPGPPRFADEVERLAAEVAGAR